MGGLRDALIEMPIGAPRSDDTAAASAAATAEPSSAEASEVCAGEEVNSSVGEDASNYDNFEYLGEAFGINSQESEEYHEGEEEKEQVISVMLRNIPSHYMKEDVVTMLDDHGLGGLYVEVHVPLCFRSKNTANRKFAFIELRNPAEFSRVQATLHGKELESNTGPKKMEVLLSGRQTSQLGQRMADAITELELICSDAAGIQLPVLENAVATAQSKEKEKEELDLSGTNVLLRNIPCRLTQEDVQSLLDHAGLHGTYKSVVLPLNVRSRKPCNKGYAFVLFKEPSHYDECHKLLHGKPFGCTNSAKQLEVVLADRQMMALSAPRRSAGARAAQVPQAARQQWAGLPFPPGFESISRHGQTQWEAGAVDSKQADWRTGGRVPLDPKAARWNPTGKDWSQAAHAWHPGGIEEAKGWYPDNMQGWQQWDSSYVTYGAKPQWEVYTPSCSQW